MITISELGIVKTSEYSNMNNTLSFPKNIVERNVNRVKN